jgi:hypothetical protein
MNVLATIAAGVASLTLVTWAVLRHRRKEVEAYPLSWKGWVVRLGLVGTGLAFLLIPKVERTWVMFIGCALITMPLLFRQIAYEVETRLLSSSSKSKRDKQLA